MIECPYPGCGFEAKNNTGLAAHTRMKHKGEKLPTNPDQDKEMREEEIEKKSSNSSEIKVKELAEKEVEDIELEKEGEEEEEEKGDGEGEEEAPDIDYTQGDVDNLCEMLIGLPALFFGDHLIRTKEQVKPFARQLYLYCQKKGINPLDYFFDELGLALAGGVLVRGMWDDHKKEKAKQKREKEKEVEEED